MENEEMNRLAQILFGEDGVLELTAPEGDVFHVTCRRGVGMAFLRVDGTERNPREGSGWRIRRPSGKGAGYDGRS